MGGSIMVILIIIALIAGIIVLKVKRGREEDEYNSIYHYNIEDELPQNMKDIKRRALDGVAEAQYRMGIYYRNQWNQVSGKPYAAANRKTRLYYSRFGNAGWHFLHKAQSQGHSGAIDYLKKH